MFRTEQVRADVLRPGDQVVVRGQQYRVGSVEVRGKKVRLTLVLGSNVFPGVTRGKDLFERVLPAELVEWDKAADLDEPIVSILGGRLVAVEDEGGRLLVPPVDDSTILGHLATVHGVRWDGVGVKDAKAWVKAHDPAGNRSLDEVLSALDVSMAYELHDRLHLDLVGMSRPHWHREKVPV